MSSSRGSTTAICITNFILGIYVYIVIMLPRSAGTPNLEFRNKIVNTSTNAFRVKSYRNFYDILLLDVHVQRWE